MNKVPTPDNNYIEVNLTDVLQNYKIKVDSSLGRGGFRVEYISERNRALTPADKRVHISGEFINPVGPFRKTVELSFKISIPTRIYRFVYKDSFFSGTFDSKDLELLFQRFVPMINGFLSDYKNGGSYSDEKINFYSEENRAYQDYIQMLNEELS